jgi:hypothetical protein
VRNAHEGSFLYLNPMKYERPGSMPDFDRLAFRKRLLGKLINSLIPNATTKVKPNTMKYEETASPH